MKRKLLLLFVLLMTAATGAWAQTISFYLEVSGTSATLEYGSVPDGKPYYTGSGWYGTGASTAQDKDSGVTTITVGTSCQDFEGTSLLYLFGNFGKLTTINNIGNLNMTNVTDMSCMFHSCGVLTTLDLTSLNTANVTSMNSMFAFCVKLTSFDISGWNTEKVENMSGMFNNCTSLTSLDLTSLNTASVVDMSYMFNYCTNLTSLDISGWNTANVKNMSGMFNSCTSLTTLDLTSLNTTNVTNMSSMFYYCTNLTAIYVGNYWNTDKITEDTEDSNSKDMFHECSNLPNYNSSFIDKTRANTGADGYLNKVKVTANLANGAYWSTFYSNAYNHQAPEGTQMFAVKLEGTTITMTEIGDRIVKSDEGVVLKQVTESSEPTTTIIMTLTGTEPTGDFSVNSLTGTMTSITNPGNAYVLNYTTENGVGFYKLTSGGTIGANKAYLTYSGPNARGFFGLDDTTGIEMPVVEGNDNADTVVYDLQGRRVAQPTKGLYIVNGKKVVIK